MFGRPVKGHTIRHGSVIASAALDLVAGHWLRHVLGIKDTNERLQTLAMLWVWRIANLCMRRPEPGSRRFLGR